MKQFTESLMNCRRITLPDGRYMIFYTFVPQELPDPPAKSKEQTTQQKPPAKEN
jgi:hypothetical protein